MKRAAPPIASLPFAILSVGVASYLSLASLAVSDALSKYLTWQGLALDLAGDTPALNRVQLAVEFLTKPSGSYLGLARALGLPTVELDSPPITHSYEALQLAIQDDFDGSVAALALANLARRNALTPDQNEDLSARKRVLENERTQLSAELPRIDRARVSILKRIELITTDLREVLALPSSAPVETQPEENDDSIDDHDQTLADDLEMPKVYTSGVLKGLPVLPEITDDVRDLGALKTVVKVSGGDVKQFASKASAMNLQEKLAALAQGTEAELASLEELAERRRATQARLAEIPSDIKALRRVALTASRASLIASSAVGLDDIYHPEQIFRSFWMQGP